MIRYEMICKLISHRVLNFKLPLQVSVLFLPKSPKLKSGVQSEARKTRKDSFLINEKLLLKFEKKKNHFDTIEFVFVNFVKPWG